MVQYLEGEVGTQCGTLSYGFDDDLGTKRRTTGISYQLCRTTFLLSSFYAILNAFIFLKLILNCPSPLLLPSLDSHYFEEGNVQLDAKHECKDSEAFQVITYLHAYQHLLCH